LASAFAYDRTVTTPCRDVLFPAGDEQCHAWLYLPDPDPSKSERPPVIVMGHGLGAVKALRLGAFAERFQAAGYACLVFDYRYFGDSTGEPRELLSISRQREDWRAALNFVRTLRLTAIGSSCGAPRSPGDTS